jgi:predicted HicB family RNase H-like nuclease
MKKIKARDYLKVVEWSDEDNCFIGSAPPLIGYCCHGKTEAEVMEQLTGIVEEWVALYQKEGKKLPAPSAGGKYSGKFQLRTGEELHRFLAISALQAGDSLNNYIVKRLKAATCRS